MCGFCSLVYLFLFFLLFCFGMYQRIPIRVLVKRLTVTTQIWIMTRHQYGISALVPQTSLRGETSGGVTNIGCLLRLTFSWKMYCPLEINKVRNHVGTMFYQFHDNDCDKYVLPHLSWVVTRAKIMCAGNLTQEILNIACNIHHTPWTRRACNINPFHHACPRKMSCK